MDNQTFLKQFLEQFKKPIPCQWRVQSYSKTKPLATVMSYIDARDCMDLLDQYAVYGWNREHYTIDGKIYCRVGIYMPDGTIQLRSDCGTESNTEKEKGQSSDSFKRACVNFGIGRFLYDLPIIYVDTDVVKINADYSKNIKANYPKFIDKQRNEIKDLNAYCNNLAKIEQTEKPAERKPLLNEATFAKLLPRVQAKEAGIIFKTVQAFQLTENQFNQLLTA